MQDFFGLQPASGATAFKSLLYGKYFQKQEEGWLQTHLQLLSFVTISTRITLELIRPLYCWEHLSNKFKSDSQGNQNPWFVLTGFWFYFYNHPFLFFSSFAFGNFCLVGLGFTMLTSISQHHVGNANTSVSLILSPTETRCLPELGLVDYLRESSGLQLCVGSCLTVAEERTKQNPHRSNPRVGLDSIKHCSTYLKLHTCSRALVNLGQSNGNKTHGHVFEQPWEPMRSWGESIRYDHCLYSQMKQEKIVMDWHTESLLYSRKCFQFLEG